MDADLESMSQVLSQSFMFDRMDVNLAAGHSVLPAMCSMCHCTLPSDDSGDLVCGDCKFLLLEDIGTSRHDAHRRIARVRRSRNGSHESIDDLFSQQFSHALNLARQNQFPVFEHENQFVDGDAAISSTQQTSSRNTLSGSRRWRGVISDTETDGFDSLYGGSESNVSFSSHRLSFGESDAISFSTYGGDSDASVDGRSFLNSEIFISPDYGNDFDSDTDIDPMQAGLNQWNSDLEENDDYEDDDEWEEADTEESIFYFLGAGAQAQRSLSSSETNIPENWHRWLRSSENDSLIHLRSRERRPTYFSTFWNSGNHVEGRGADELLEHFVDVESLGHRIPPTAVSFLNSLDLVVISEEHQKLDVLTCAICKDSLSVGNTVNQLPCSHIYHPSCIMPWLTTRNTCPLCRYELPTNDYEDKKQNTGIGLETREIPQFMNGDSSSEDSESSVDDEAREYGHHVLVQGEVTNIDNLIGRSNMESARGRWAFLAAAPVVSLMGIALFLWFGNPVTKRRDLVSHDLPHVRQHNSNSFLTLPPNQRENNGGSRWWCLI